VSNVTVGLAIGFTHIRVLLYEEDRKRRRCRNVDHRRGWQAPPRRTHARADFTQMLAVGAALFLMLAISIYLGIRRASLWWSVAPSLCLAVLFNIPGSIVDARYGPGVVVQRIGESAIQWASLIGILCIVQALARALSVAVSVRRKNRLRGN
jgi:hypothetical protein